MKNIRKRFLNRPNGTSDYISFVKEKFPHSLWLKDKKIQDLTQLYKLVYENLLVYELIKENINQYAENHDFRFLNDYVESINTLLIAMPVNYPGFSNYNVRVATESLLKYLYSITFPSKTETQVAQTPFRHLKDELKLEPSNHAIKQEIIQLLDIYGKASKVIHKHTVDSSDLTATINYFIETDFKELKQNISTLNRMVNFFLITVCHKTKFDYNSLTLASKIKIQNHLSKARCEKIKQFILTETS
ncbi:hypothetical protein CN283_29875 [Bacillus thuringiensis]|uniref:hypothetical protein n=1 Tax=Bacillus thuringiensis TaxID=1428 RepID=UPI000BF7AC27|nr:hypothetical protein [Bacillus thuringiensis]PFB77513.1 hypothetical protein CN283_29875 [Bacillus thuringiensis]